MAAKDSSPAEAAADLLLFTDVTGSMSQFLATRRSSLQDTIDMSALFSAFDHIGVLPLPVLDTLRSFYLALYFYVLRYLGYCSSEIAKCSERGDIVFRTGSYCEYLEEGASRGRGW